MIARFSVHFTRSFSRLFTLASQSPLPCPFSRYGHVQRDCYPIISCRYTVTIGYVASNPALYTLYNFALQTIHVRWYWTAQNRETREISWWECNRGVWCKEYSFLEIICPSVSYLSNNSFDYFILKLYHIRTIRACVFSTNIRGKKARESYPFVRLSFIIRKVSFLFLLWKRNSLKYNFQKLDSFVYRSLVQLCSCKKILEFRPNIEMYFY